MWYAHRRALAHGSVISRLASNLGVLLLIKLIASALQPRALIHFLSSLFDHQSFPTETTWQVLKTLFMRSLKNTSLITILSGLYLRFDGLLALSIRMHNGHFFLIVIALIMRSKLNGISYPCHFMYLIYSFVPSFVFLVLRLRFNYFFAVVDDGQYHGFRRSNLYWSIGAATSCFGNHLFG